MPSQRPGRMRVRDRDTDNVVIHKRTPSLQGIHNQDKALYMFGVSEEEFARHKALQHLGANEPVYQESLRVMRHHPIENRCDLDEYDEAIINSSEKRRQSDWRKLRSMLGSDWSRSYKAHQRLGTSPSEVVEKRSRELGSLNPFHFAESFFSDGSSSASPPPNASPRVSTSGNEIRRRTISYRRLRAQSTHYFVCPFWNTEEKSSPTNARATGTTKSATTSRRSSSPSLSIHHSRSPSPNSTVFSRMLSMEVSRHGLSHINESDLIDMWQEMSLCVGKGLSVDVALQHVYEVFPHVFDTRLLSRNSVTGQNSIDSSPAAIMICDEKDDDEIFLEEKADDVPTTALLPPSSTRRNRRRAEVRVENGTDRSATRNDSNSGQSVYVALLKCNVLCSASGYCPSQVNTVSFFVDLNSKHFHDMSLFLFALRSGYFLTGFENGTRHSRTDLTSMFFCNNIVDFFHFFGPMIRRYNTNVTALHMAVSCVLDEIEDKNAPYSKWSDKLKKCVFIVCYLLHMGYYLRDKNPNGGTHPLQMLRNHAPRVFKHVFLFHQYLKRIYLSEFEAIRSSLPRTYFDVHLASLIAGFTFHSHEFKYHHQEKIVKDLSSTNASRLNDIPAEHAAVIRTFHEFNMQVTKQSQSFRMLVDEC